MPPEVTPPEVQVVTWSKLGPGVYTSSHGEMRIVASELLRATGRPDTLVNRIKVCNATKKMIAALPRAAAPVIVTTDPPPPEVEVLNV